ncbi:MAG: hypothetical protein JWN14_1787 [Chthonomonadales bacterium]|nr:hypothetical protein [Chthonomonadales bacterium]
MKKIFHIGLLCAFVLLAQLQFHEAKADSWVNLGEIYTAQVNSDPTFTKTTLGVSGNLMVGATTTSSTDHQIISYTATHLFEYRTPGGGTVDGHVFSGRKPDNRLLHSDL